VAKTKESETETALTTLYLTLAVTKREINPMWILCDNESTVDVFKNKSILTNTLEGNEEGGLLGYGWVYYHLQATANIILSFHNIVKMFGLVKYDNNHIDAFIVTRDDGLVIEFIPSEEGLYYYDFNKSIERKKDQLHNCGRFTMKLDQERA